MHSETWKRKPLKMRSLDAEGNSPAGGLCVTGSVV